MKIIGYAFSVGVAWYVLLEMDFGTKEHVFSGLRRFYQAQKQEFLALTDEDIKGIG